MAYSKAMGKHELEFIRNHFGQLTTLEMAQEMGRSKTAVNDAIKQMGLRDEPTAMRARETVEDEPREPAASIDDVDVGAELVRLHSLLKRASLNASPQMLPKIAEQDTKVLAMISDMQGGSDADTDELASILCSINFRAEPQ